MKYSTWSFNLRCNPGLLQDIAYIYEMKCHCNWLYLSHMQWHCGEWRIGCSWGFYRYRLLSWRSPGLLLGSYHFLPGGGASVCDGRLPIFSGSPLCICKKNLVSPFAYGEKFLSPLWPRGKILVPPQVGKILFPPSLTLKNSGPPPFGPLKNWSPPLSTPKQTPPSRW